jgi:DNA-binding MarR family transcriptional regulator
MKAQKLALAEVEGALKRAGLPTLAWYDALLEVERAGAPGVRPFELERALLLAQHNLSRLLDRMEREGLIARTRSPEDGRGQIVRLTETGKAVRRRMWPVYARAIDATVAEHLNAKQIEALDDVLGELVRRLARS